MEKKRKKNNFLGHKMYVVTTMFLLGITTGQSLNSIGVVL